MPDAYMLRIFGRVQGVAFRYHARIQARNLGLYGWVRNMPDGSVELFCEGKPERLAEMLNWVQKGPPGARVSLVKKRKAPSRGCMAFTIEY